MKRYSEQVQTQLLTFITISTMRHSSKLKTRDIKTFKLIISIRMKTLQGASEWSRMDDAVLDRNILVSKFHILRLKISRPLRCSPWKIFYKLWRILVAKYHNDRKLRRIRFHRCFHHLKCKQLIIFSYFELQARAMNLMLNFQSQINLPELVWLIRRGTNPWY